MTPEFKTTLHEIIKNHSEELIAEWLTFFEDNEQKNEEHRHYDDFLGFFEECVEEGLDINGDAAQALQHFLLKIKDIIGEDYFFNFHNSIYTCFLKFPIFKLIEKEGLFVSENIIPITSFFEAMTSHIVLSLISRHQTTQETTNKELEEREAPMSEIWEGVIMVSIVGTLDSQRVLQIMDKVLAYIEKHRARHVIVDISAIYDVNSEVTSQLIKLNNAIHFMGANAYISGITSNIAKSLTHLDINFGDIQTFSTTKHAVEHIISQEN